MSISIERMPRHPIVKWNWHDTWVGVYSKYWRTPKRDRLPGWPIERIADLFVCPVPCLVFAFRITLKQEKKL